MLATQKYLVFSATNGRVLTRYTNYEAFRQEIILEGKQCVL